MKNGTDAALGDAGVAPFPAAPIDQCNQSSLPLGFFRLTSAPSTCCCWIGVGGLRIRHLQLHMLSMLFEANMIFNCIDNETT